MSIRSLTDLAAKRDEHPAGTMVPSESPLRDHERVQDAVISAIPSEVLALYTALTGGTLALLVQDDPGSYLPYRWILLVTAVLFTPTAVHVGHRRKSVARTPSAGARRTPYQEMSAATVAAAAWFLAMPASPFLASLTSDVAAIASGAIVVMAGAVLWAGFGNSLRTGTGVLCAEVTNMTDTDDLSQQDADAARTLYSMGVGNGAAV
jgi:hypothetical protein